MQSPLQQTASADAPAQPATFASILSALARPAPKASSLSWDEALADDVATLSYESALKAHSRYRPAEEPPADPMPAAQPAAPRQNAHQAPAKNPHQPSSGAGDLKSASITIRMSQPECAQLKQRAAEAGMTISAYLRSCTFEAEALRGQVKEALAQLRAAASAGSKSSVLAAERHKRMDWLPRIFPWRAQNKPAC